MPPFQTLASGPQKRKSDTDGRVIHKRPAQESINAGNREQYWMVQWREFQARKHKTWDSDAVLFVRDGKCIISDMEDKVIATGSPPEAQSLLQEGQEFKFASREFRLDRVITRQEYLSGACFGRNPISTPSAIRSNNCAAKQFIPPQPKTTVISNAARPEKRGIPLQEVNLFNDPLINYPEEKKVRESYWTANWRTHQARKNKTWDGDAFISHTGNKLTMISEEGKILGIITWKGDALRNGYPMRFGNKYVELDSEVSSDDLPNVSGLATNLDDNTPPDDLPSPHWLAKAIRRDDGANSSQPVPAAKHGSKFITPASFYALPQPKPKASLHDPNAEGAVVMKSPSKEHERKFNKKNLPIVPVVIDPIVARYLRPHQKEGVKFMYESVMGLRKHEGQGCILADEMGLGKTLQTICLIWTLLKQNPYAGAGSVIGKAIIVCPVSLINNWKAEFHKWLGRDRVGVFTGDKDKATIKQFINSKIHQVLIIGYERLRTVVDDLVYCQYALSLGPLFDTSDQKQRPPIGLIVCDEGHRLKSANNKTTTMFKTLRTPRRIILSGTPIQNDLGEFHAMADFCNPGLLDDYAAFRRLYEVPILKSRVPDCTAKETEIGESRSAQLLTIARSFVLRREASILKNYLPPKYEYVVFVTPTKLQLAIFTKILDPDKLNNLMQSSTAESLALINMLTKISNSPILLKATADKAKSEGCDSMRKTSVEDALKLLPERAQIEDFSLSGKLAALSNLLKALKQHTEEKCIIVSHYTSTLNILEAYCQKKSYTYYRLDGQTPPAKRHEYVNSFNKSSQRSRFLFLLSSKAGGVGLNLIGASRLCLIDSDWNPSHDLQSMARIHRDGQKHPVFIYRFLTAGTIDEKIYQRQVTKLGLTNSLMGSGNSGTKSDSFSRKDLRDIFRIHPDTPCHTHELLECPCDASVINKQVSDGATIDDDSDAEETQSEKGFVVASQLRPEQINKADRAYLKKKKADLAALGEWTHIDCLRIGAKNNIQDGILQRLIHDGDAATDKAKPNRSRLDSLLSMVDLDNPAIFNEDASRMSVRDVPGGTLSFLFEKVSESPMDRVEDDEE